MRSIHLPDGVEPMRYFDAIVDGKYNVQGHKDKLGEVRDLIEAAFHRYHEHRSQLETMTPEPAIDGAGKDALASCWNKSDALDRLKRDVRSWFEPDSVTCPFCGIDNAKDTFEHYLPKHQFPEFIVCAYNVIPCCFQCNNPRSDWKDSDGRRLLFHMYFDEIDMETSYLFAAIDMHHRPRARYSIKSGPDDDSGFYQAYVRHFNELNLAERFGERSIMYLRAEACTINAYSSSSLEQHQRALQQRAAGRAKQYGVNDFEVATLRAASDSDEFIRYAMGGAS